MFCSTQRTLTFLFETHTADKDTFTAPWVDTFPTASEACKFRAVLWQYLQTNWTVILLWWWQRSNLFVVRRVLSLFGHFEKTHGARRGEEESEVIDYGRALYVKHFGETRRPPKLPRLDKGVSKSTRQPVDT